MTEQLLEGRERERERDTYNDWDGGGSAQDLLDQAISVVQGLHDLSLIFGDLKFKKKTNCNM